MVKAKSKKSTCASRNAFILMELDPYQKEVMEKKGRELSKQEVLEFMMEVKQYRKETKMRLHQKEQMEMFKSSQ